MDYCKKCKNFGCNAAGTERTTTDCEDYMSHLPTNYDRIISKTTEELAKWIAGDVLNLTGGSLEMATEAWADWLRKEAKEGE